MKIRTCLTRCFCAAALWFATLPVQSAPVQYLSPSALALSSDQNTVFTACAGSAEVLALDLRAKSVARRFPVHANPIGLALSTDGRQLLVTCAAPQSTLLLLDAATGQTNRVIRLGHTATSPVVANDGRTAYVCYRFEDCVGVIDLQAGTELRRIPVVREPVSAAISKDGKYLLVANHLQSAAANLDEVRAMVSVIDCAQQKVIKQLALPSGSTALNAIAVSPDGRFAAVTHILARFQIPAAQLERGWMNTNAKTIIDMQRLEVLDTVLLDGVDSGAANPWGVAWGKDLLVVAHSGTHEVSIIDFPRLLQKLLDRHQKLRDARDDSARYALVPAHDLTFLADLRERIALPTTDRGPRAIVATTNGLVTANYFSDSLTHLEFNSKRKRPESIPLGPQPAMSEERLGEFYFNDAAICFQGWQSCATCHPGEARVDALNWDLLNDGIGNPKNTKTLLLSHRTPPAMSMGVRETAETAVRAGIRNILMTVQPDSLARSLDAYLKSLKPVPSPKLVDGKLSLAAKRGEQVFQKANCSVCHPGATLFTDLQSYDVGTRSGQDRTAEQFDTPSLVEVWRTAPYLHDGSAPTIRDVLTGHNRKDQHGITSNLTPQELDDLCEYVLSL